MKRSWPMVFSFAAVVTAGCGNGHRAAPADAGSEDALLPDVATDLAAPFVPDMTTSADLANPAAPLKVATFNLHCLFDSPDQRFDGIAAEAKTRGLDALAVQEACESASGNGSDNAAFAIASRLSTLTGVQWAPYWIETHLAWSNQYREGVAVIAPAASLTNDRGSINLPSEDGLARKAVWARIDSGHGSFYLTSTHFSISSDDQDRAREAQALLTVALGHTSIPQIVTGDFNATPDKPAISTMTAGPPAFVDTWAMKNPGQNGFTVEAPNPSSRIDYVFVSAAHLNAVDQMEIAFNVPYNGVQMSDHYGLAATFTTK